MTTGYPARLPIVALVASAGGLDALGRVLGPLPADLPAAILVAQHLDPCRTSHLTSILAGRTALRVVEAADGDVLVPGVVLVAPAARHLLLTPEPRVVLVAAGALPPARPSADLLLATLAVTCGPRALAVVLTGKGTDAQAGIRAVARCGGTVFAQDEATSAHFGMPGAAIGTGLVDATLPLSEIAGAVLGHVSSMTRRGGRGLTRTMGATRRNERPPLP
ncbi:chemotaxis protein CheB [Amycolatopsis sp. H6(2020)]|nr:chemotaxis protein CheB [Amycolatopsis sp. H6(2020)]